MSDLFVGLDLGQSRDYSAVVVVHRVEFVAPKPKVPPFMIRGGSDPPPDPPRRENHHHVVHCERARLGTPYVEVVRRVREILDSLPTSAELVVDATGVGRAVIDLFDAKRIYPTSVTLTGGDTVTRDGSSYRVPKRDLVSAVEVLLQEKRLRIAADMTTRVALVEELLSFRANVTASGHDAYGAVGARAHDDLVIALALAVWRSRDTERDLSRKPLSGVSEHFSDEDDPDIHWIGDPRHRHTFGYHGGGSRFIGGGVGGLSTPDRRPFWLR